jgi:hypothetical protein
VSLHLPSSPTISTNRFHIFTLTNYFHRSIDQSFNHHFHQNHVHQSGERDSTKRALSKLDQEYSNLKTAKSDTDM